MVSVFTVDYVKLKLLKLRYTCQLRITPHPSVSPKHGYLGTDLP